MLIPKATVTAAALGARAWSTREKYSASAGIESHHQPTGGKDTYSATPVTAATSASAHAWARDARCKISR